MGSIGIRETSWKTLQGSNLPNLGYGGILHDKEGKMTLKMENNVRVYKGLMRVNNQVQCMDLV